VRRDYSDMNTFWRNGCERKR